jgi:hypothetical protein
MHQIDPWYWIAVAAVAVLSSARLTRFLVYDEFPPIMWLRERLKVVEVEDLAKSRWKLLAVCGFCMSFWVTLAVVTWGYLTDWQTAWWLVNGTFAASYLAASYVARDGDK